MDFYEYIRSVYGMTGLDYKCLDSDIQDILQAEYDLVTTSDNELDDLNELLDMDISDEEIEKLLASL